MGLPRKILFPAIAVVLLSGTAFLATQDTSPLAFQDTWLNNRVRVTVIHAPHGTVSMTGLFVVSRGAPGWDRESAGVSGRTGNGRTQLTPNPGQTASFEWASRTARVGGLIERSVPPDSTLIVMVDYADGVGGEPVAKAIVVAAVRSDQLSGSRLMAARRKIRAFLEDVPIVQEFIR